MVCGGDDGDISELKSRIAATRKLRRGLETSVVWQREEYWRLERALGLGRDSWMAGGTGSGGGGKWVGRRYVELFVILIKELLWGVFAYLLRGEV